MNVGVLSGFLYGRKFSVNVNMKINFTHVIINLKHLV